MKKNLLLFLMLTSFAVSAFSQQYIVKFNIKNKKEAYKLPEYVQVDDVKGNIVTAYLYNENFEKFKKLGYDFQLQDHPSKGKALTMATTVAQMANWDRYPTFEVLNQMIDQFATDYPDICRVETIGTSEQGRDVKVIKITDNPDIDEEEPEFYYTGQMHGDEIVAYIMFLRLADYMLSNYGTDTRVTNLINNTEIWINPISNPDGTYSGGNNTVSSATRANANSVDLNRNFPSPNTPNPSHQNENEVQMQIAFAQAHNFVMSANSHSGIELVNYPWDSWTSSHPHPDNDWWEHVSYNYADTVHANAPSSYFTGQGDGVTHGGDWYVVDGSRQDNMGYFQYCREVTLELSDSKMLDCNVLPAHWNYNRSAMLGYIEECHYGFHGTVKNTSDEPLNAKIEITSHDLDNSEVYTDPAIGDYYRPIAPGLYTITYSSTGYVSQNHTIEILNWKDAITKNVILGTTTNLHTLSGNVTEYGTGTALENVQISIIDNPISPENTNISGNYSFSNIEIGTYFLIASKNGYSSDTLSIEMTGNDATLDFVLKPNVTISGTITEDGTGNPIENVTVEVLNSSIPSVLTNSSGDYTINNVSQTTHQIKASKTGYSFVTKTVDISTTTTIDFVLTVSNAISFETEIPSIFTFDGNADWTRVNNVPDGAYDGTWAMKSGTISNNETSVMQSELNITLAGNISFYKKVSSEGNYDFLKFYIDDIEKGSWSGEVDWSQETFAVTTGIHTFKWEYSKDGSSNNGSDCAWVDYIEFPQYEIPPTFSISGIIADAISGDPINNANVGLVGTNFITTTLSDGTYTIENVLEGTYDLKSSADSYTNSIRNITLSGENLVNTNMELNPSDLITFETNIPSDFSFSGDLNWTKNSDKAYDGFYSMKSGSIEDSETTSMEVTKTTQAGTISFYKFVSSESGYDYLHFYIDDSEKDTWSGTSQTTWDEASYTVTEGTHTYKWEYIKDSSAEDGDDCVWVDFIDFPAPIASTKNNLAKNTKLNISPNPFNENTSFEFYINKKSNVFIGIYSYNGQLVKTLLNNQVDSGNHRVIWNGRNNNNQQLANGLYFCKIINGGNSISEKIILMK